MLSPLDALGVLDGPRPAAEINVTPFIDVALVLLVIFMVAAPLALAEVPLKLPRSAARPATLPGAPLVVSLDKAGRLYLDGAETPAPVLEARIAELTAADPERTIHFRADESLPYGRVMTVLGRLGARGAARLSLLTEKDAGAP